MKRFIYFLLSLIILLTWSSCRKDFSFTSSIGNLEFSKDTVYLDTVFTNIGSSTYNLKVYNRSNEDIVIPTLRLARGQNSMYRLNVDGLTGSGVTTGKEFENVELHDLVDGGDQSVVTGQFLIAGFDAGCGG